MFTCATKPWRELAVEEFRKSKNVLFMRKVHILKKDPEDLPYGYMQSEISKIGPVQLKPTGSVTVRPQARMGAPKGWEG